MDIVESAIEIIGVKTRCPPYITKFLLDLSCCFKICCSVKCVSVTHTKTLNAEGSQNSELSFIIYVYIYPAPRNYVRRGENRTAN